MNSPRSQEITSLTPTCTEFVIVKSDGVQILNYAVNLVRNEGFAGCFFLLNDFFLSSLSHIN